MYLTAAASTTLSQNTWREVQELGMVDLYRKWWRKVVLWYDWWPCIPTRGKCQWWHGLSTKQHTWSCKRMLDYFEKMYVSGISRRIQTVREEVLAVRVSRIRLCSTQHCGMSNRSLWMVMQGQIISARHEITASSGSLSTTTNKCGLQLMPSERTRQWLRSSSSNFCFLSETRLLWTRLIFFEICKQNGCLLRKLGWKIGQKDQFSSGPISL